MSNLDLDYDDSGDYSDFSTDLVEVLTERLDAIERPSAQRNFPIIAGEDTVAPSEPPQPAVLTALVTGIEDVIEDTSSSRPTKILGQAKRGPLWRQPNLGETTYCPDQNPKYTISSSCVEHPSSTEGRERERERQITRESKLKQDEPVSPTEDHRSPVERFRRPPNKAFSVTDLVSPSWCELQHWYSLTKRRRKRTAAMKRGSIVHKSLEDEIYTTAPVEVNTKEDAWALRIWNVIQGLRMLREHGITRELEVWGIIDGELVNGVIDQLSYECTDSELEATASEFYANSISSRDTLPEKQISISDFLLAEAQGGIRLSDLGKQNPPKTVNAEASVQDCDPDLYALPRIFITDDKTTTRSVPSVKSSGFRPTLLQLHLYYHMLNRLITSNDVTMNTFAERYHLDLHSNFSDAFISQVGGLNDEYSDACSPPLADVSDPKATSSQDSTTILINNGNLCSLWNYMKDQLRLTFIPLISESRDVAPSIPAPTQPTSLREYSTLLSPVLTARYRSPTAQVSGSRSFLFDPNTMTSYIEDQMQWWRGQRDPRGVNVIEAWKCTTCDFKDECSWRTERELWYSRRNRG